MKKVSKKLPKVMAVLWTNTTTKDGLHPVKIRVTYDRKVKYYPVQVSNENLYLSPDQFDRAKGWNPRGENRERQLQIQAAETAALEAIEKATQHNRPFTFDRFETEYLTDGSKHGILKLYEETLQGLYHEKRIGTYKAYKCAYEAFKKFRRGKDIDPVDVNPKVLKSFESWLMTPRKEANRKTRKAAGKNTVAMYMRSLRVIYNNAISENPSLRDFYPFARKQNDTKGYAIKKGAGRKGQALSIEELQKFIGIETTPGTYEHEAKLLFLFMLYTQGMNMKDVCYLKYKNIKGDSIEYIRRKTKDTERNQEAMTVPLTDAISSIIVELGKPDKRPESYVFGFIDDNMDILYRESVIAQKIKHTNKYLKILCVENGLPGITTYWSRHSYASLLKSTGQPVEMIRELLGHSDIKTTESYLQRFDLDERRKVNESLTAKLKVS